MATEGYLITVASENSTFFPKKQFSISGSIENKYDIYILLDQTCMTESQITGKSVQSLHHSRARADQQVV